MIFLQILASLICSTGCAYATNSVQVFEAVTGGAAYLPCDFYLPSKPNTISLIMWYRESVRAPIYTLDFRKGPPDEAKHFTSPDFTNRAKFDISNRPPLLKVSPVKETDRGTYKCRIEYRRSRTITRNVKLKVIVPPKTLVIMDDRGQRMHQVAGPYDEGAYLSLICEADGGDPLPNVTWWRNNVLIDDTFMRTSQGRIRNELTILELRRSDLMSELVCQAANTNLTKPTNESVRVDLNLKPLYVRITTPRQPLRVGDDVRLDCETSGSRPPAKITWWMNSRKLLSEEETFLAGRGLTQSSIVIRPKKEDHGKAVICKSENPSLPYSSLEDMWYLDILYPPEVSLNLGANLKYSTIKEGSDVYFECLIRANPPPIEVSWYFESTPLHSNQAAGIIISNQSLVIQNVQKKHRGRYSCSARNSEGYAESLTLLLEVRYAPRCKPSKKTTYGVGRGEVINISCEVDADPSDVTFRWTLDNSLDEIPLRNFSTNGSFSTVTLAPKTVLEYGSVLCRARNSVGEQKEPCVTKIIVAGPPDPVKNCHVSNRTTSWLILACEPGYDGGLKQRFHLDVYNSAVEHLHLNLTSPDIPTFSVGNLPAGTQFVFVVYASNEKGKSNTVALVGSTLSKSEVMAGSQRPRAVSPLVAVLLACLSVFFGAGTTALVLLYVRKKRRKGRRRRSRITEKVSVEEEKSDAKFEEILKKAADEIIENSTACPDVVPPNNGYGPATEGNANKSGETTKEGSTPPASAQATESKQVSNTQNTVQQKAEVEVVVQNISNPNTVTTRVLGPSTSGVVPAMKARDQKQPHTQHVQNAEATGCDDAIEHESLASTSKKCLRDV